MTSSTPKRIRSLAELNAATDLYRRADKAWDKGRKRDAFRLMLQAAESGLDTAWPLVATFYDQGFGVKRDEDAAL